MLFFKTPIKVFLLFLLSIEGFGQTIDFEHFSDDNGLINNDVSSVVKDKEGFVWIGTMQGLDRYDGYSCKHFVNDPENVHSIAENKIKCLHATDDHKIYIGYYGKGFSVYDKKTETFENYFHDHQDPSSISHDTILVFFAGKDGIVWIGTNSGLDRFDPVQKKITRFTPFDKLSNKAVAGITDDNEGNLWLYGPSNRPCKLHLKDFHYTYLIEDGLDERPNDGLDAPILHDRNQNLWFGNEWEGLFRYNIKNKKLEKIPIQNPSIRPIVLKCLTEDSDGNIWIGTQGAGLYKYSPEKNIFHNYQYIPNISTNLSSNLITCVYESQPGVLWIGTSTYGLNIWKRDKKKFEKFNMRGMPNNTINYPSVIAIAPAPDGKIWLGTEGGGLNLFDPVTRKFNYFTKENALFRHNYVKTILSNKDGTLWYGTNEDILCKVNFKTGVTKCYGDELLKTRIKGQQVCAWTLYQSSDNKMYISMLHGGVKIYDLAKSKFLDDLHVSKEFDEIIADRIWFVKEDSKHRLWIGTESKGVVCYNPKTNGYHVFQHNVSDPTSLKSNIVKTMYEGTDGTFWFGTHNGGLDKLIDFEKKKFVNYMMKDGLPNNNVKAIMPDKKGNLWLATQKGISCFYIKENKFKNFDPEDGLQGYHFHTNSNYRTKDGNIYIGGNDGFNIFNPDNMRFDSLPPKIVITDFKIFDQSVTPNNLVNEKKYLDKSIVYTEEIELNPDDNIFSIDFTALDFTSPNRNKYAYKLEGFNEKWTYVNADKRTATYTNLYPGTYTFVVIASNGDGVWNDEGTRLRIIVLPPFYATWWFRILAVIVIAAAVVSFYLWRTRYIRLRNLELKSEVEKQTMQLNDMNEELRSFAEELSKQNIKSQTLYEELTEGLEAAKIIQTAILPSKAVIEKAFGPVGIFYKPKDVVSGDFYWFTKMGNKSVLAVVDCTGHGVAGAFMTFVGYEILNQITKKDIPTIPTNPGLIISLLNQEILNSMNHYNADFVNAGMDVSLSILDKETDTLYYSGANNPLYITRNEEILIFKGDRQGVGGKQKSENYMFQTHSVQLEKGDQLYMFSDGYADQMGGSEGNKKFMYSRFRNLLLEIRSMGITERISLINKEFEDWKGNNEQLDDVIVIGFEY